MGKAQRASFTAAGYVWDDERELESELYITRDPAGSKRDLLRDDNRIGYSGAALYEQEIPFEFFAHDEEEQIKKQKKQQAAARRAQEEAQRTFLERLRRAARREKGAVLVCAMLIVVNLTLISAWGQTLVGGVSRRDQIASYEASIASFDMQIEAAHKTLEEASKLSIIRDEAQRMGMLRSGLGQEETIYVQTNALQEKTSLTADTQEESGLLDWLLSVADIFDFSI